MGYDKQLNGCDVWIMIELKKTKNASGGKGQIDSERLCGTSARDGNRNRTAGK